MADHKKNKSRSEYFRWFLNEEKSNRAETFGADWVFQILSSYIVKIFSTDTGLGGFKKTFDLKRQVSVRLYVLTEELHEIEHLNITATFWQFFT